MSLLTLQQGLRAGIVEDAVDPSLLSPGLEIYRNAYRARLVETLRSGFEKTWAWIGDEAFDTAAIHHIILYPPTSWTLDDYGQAFPETLSALYPGDPEVAELAWLEWQMQQAFAALDGPVVDASAFGEAVQTAPDWSDVEFHFVPSLAVRPVATNCTALWQAMADELTPPDPQILETPMHLIVWRQGFSPHFRMVEADEMTVLSMATAQRSFGAMCAAVDKGSPEDSVAWLGTLLGQWLKDGLIARIGLG